MVVLVLMVMRGRGGTTRARARGIGERRTGGETECIQRWGGGGKAGAGGDDGGGGGAGGSGEEQESRAEVAGHNQYRKVVSSMYQLKVSSKYFL